jgi:hypothetical protein
MLSCSIVSGDFVVGCRERSCTPHVSQNNTKRRSAIDARSTRHPGHRISTIERKRIEELFGWIKTVSRPRTCHRARPAGVVFRAHRRSLQSRSHPEISGCEDGMALPGVLIMKENRHKYRACEAVRRPSIVSSPPQPHTSRNSAPPQDLSRLLEWLLARRHCTNKLASLEG